jgi:hypothetical protein
MKVGPYPMDLPKELWPRWLTLALAGVVAGLAALPAVPAALGLKLPEQCLDQRTTVSVAPPLVRADQPRTRVGRNGNTAL